MFNRNVIMCTRFEDTADMFRRCMRSLNLLRERMESDFTEMKKDLDCD